MTPPILVDQRDLTEEHWQDRAQGSIRWKSLLSGDVTIANALVCGIAIMDRDETLTLHSHAEPEVYFGIEAEVDVHSGGAGQRMKPGVALFIPSNAVHGVLAADQHVQ
jgi:quercetin dioxygenase-like cupin family protein